MQLMAIRLLRAHFREVGFDASLKQLLASRHPSGTNLRALPDAPVISVVSAMAKYGVQVTPDEVVEDIARLLPSDDAALNADFSRLKAAGLDPAFPDIESFFENAKQYLPVDMDGLTRPAWMRRIMSCPPLVTYGGSAFALLTGAFAYACGIPEPLWPFLCPGAAVVEVIGGISVLVSVAMLVCL